MAPTAAAAAAVATVETREEPLSANQPTTGTEDETKAASFVALDYGSDGASLAHACMLAAGFVGCFKSCHGRYLCVVKDDGPGDANQEHPVEHTMTAVSDRQQASFFAVFGDADSYRACVQDLRTGVFLSIDGQKKALRFSSADQPMLVKVLPSGNAAHPRFSFAEAKKDGLVLSSNRRGEPFFVSHIKSWERFEAQIVPGSVGNWRSLRQNPQFECLRENLLHPVQALLECVSRLDLTCRLRLPHGLYLAAASSLFPVDECDAGSCAPARLELVPTGEGSRAETFSFLLRSDYKLCILNSCADGETRSVSLHCDTAEQKLSLSLSEDDPAAAILSIKVLRHYGQNQSSFCIIAREDEKCTMYVSVDKPKSAPPVYFKPRPHARDWEAFTAEPSLQSVRSALAEKAQNPSKEWLAAEAGNKEAHRLRIEQAVREKREMVKAIEQAKAAEMSPSSSSNHKKALGGLPSDASSGKAQSASTSAKEKARNAKKVKSKKGKNAATGGSVAKAAVAAAPPASSSSSSPPPPSSSSEPSSAENVASSQRSAAADAGSTSGSGGGKQVVCFACKRAIVPDTLYTKALNQSFHNDCFQCSLCRKSLALQTRFRTSNDAMHRPLCDGCYAAHAAPKCTRCSLAITDTVVTARDKPWHRTCFTCARCSMPLTQTYYFLETKPRDLYCELCRPGKFQEWSGASQAANNASAPSSAAAASGAAAGRARLF
ncbi:Zyxin [Porphyridium purpureum]|uniref:Zyxin n=1 Tax=Porphyridium purpureum TaxID=35688 RepID=A0A5J4Z6B2_PORPP|nr:Zyxin [Porphyridium purpureum]|eukprot:POR7451..scf295_1